MILANIADWERYADINPYLTDLFKFVTSNDLANFATTRIVLQDEELFINMAEPTLKKKEEQKLEVHHQYIDVHIPLTGEEIIGISQLSELTVESDEPFNDEEDYALYSEPARNYVTIRPGQFCLVFPDEAHAPIIGEGKIKKAIAKVIDCGQLPF